MNAIAWLRSILFMIHDFEEIVFVKVWRARYQYCLDACTMKKIISCVLGAGIGFFIYTFFHSMEKNFENQLIKY